MFDSFFNPTPPFTAIDLSDHAVKIASARGRGKKREIVGVANADLPDGLVVNGHIQDSAGLAKRLGEIFSSGEARKLRTEAAAMTLPEEECFVRIIRVPRLPKAELDPAIRWEAESAIPMPPAEAVISWEVIEEGGGKDHYDVLVAGVPIELANSYAEMLQAVPILPVAFEPESFAISRALLGPKDQGAILIIDMGREHTGVTIVAGRRVRVTANIPIAARVFTERIAKERKVPLEKAEEMKRKFGITPKDEGLAIRKILQPVLDDIIIQIKQFFSFYETHAHVDAPVGGGETPQSKLKIQQVLLTGGDALLPHLPEYFSAAFSMPVSVGDPFRSSGGPPKHIKPHPLYATAIGLALFTLDNSSI